MILTHSDTFFPILNLAVVSFIFFYVSDVCICIYLFFEMKSFNSTINRFYYTIELLYVSLCLRRFHCILLAQRTYFSVGMVKQKIFDNKFFIFFVFSCLEIYCDLSHSSSGYMT